MTDCMPKQNDLRDAFFDALYDLAKLDRDVMFLTADMGAFSLNRFRAELPSQFINVGIAEQNLVSISAGLALSGKRTFIYSIIPFLTQRCFEQIRIDLCVMNLPVTLIGAGPGISYTSDGPTHHAIEDISIMRALPGMTILNPCDQYAAKGAAYLGYESTGPIYVRIDKGVQTDRYSGKTVFSQGAFQLKQGADLLIITTGIMTHKAFDLSEHLKKYAINAGIIDLFAIKPLNEQLLIDAIKQAKAVVTIEEHSLIGGIGSAISELMTDHHIHIPLKRFGIRDMYCTRYGDREWMHAYFNLDVPTVLNNTVDWLNRLSRQSFNEQKKDKR